MDSWWENTYSKWLLEYYQTAPTYQFVKDMHYIHKRTLVIVHPIVTDHDPGTPVTLDYIFKRKQDGGLMNAPFVLAQSLLSEAK